MQALQALLFSSDRPLVQRAALAMRRDF